MSKTKGVAHKTSGQNQASVDTGKFSAASAARGKDPYAAEVAHRKASRRAKRNKLSQKNGPAASSLKSSRFLSENHHMRTNSNKHTIRNNPDSSEPKVTVKTGAKFAQGLCFQKLFFIFLIGSLLGAIYEDILIYVRSWLETGTGVWMIHRGVIYGPFNVIYGFGAALMCWVLLRRKYNSWQIFGLSALLGGLVEYLLSFLQEMFTGTTSWDYSVQWLNLQGRTTIPIMVVWGLMGLMLVKIIYPFISDLVEKIPARIGTPLFWVLLVFMILNCLISWTAIIRQNLRHQDLPPFTPIGEFYDEYYGDEVLQKYFPNMVRSND